MPGSGGASSTSKPALPEHGEPGPLEGRREAVAVDDGLKRQCDLLGR